MTYIAFAAISHPSRHPFLFFNDRFSADQRFEKWLSWLMPEVHQRFSAEDRPRRWISAGLWSFRTFLLILPSFFRTAMRKTLRATKKIFVVYEYLWHWGGTCWCHGWSQRGPPRPPPGPQPPPPPRSIILTIERESSLPQPTCSCSLCCSPVHSCVLTH